MATILQTVFISLNFWHASMQFLSLEYTARWFPTILIMIGYQLLSLVIALPVFVALQVELNRRSNQNHSSKWSRYQLAMRILTFTAIAQLVLPIFEATRVSLGLSGTPEWLARGFFHVSIAFGTFPTAALGAFIAFMPFCFPPGLEILKLKIEEIQNYKNFLKEENFHISLLDEKTDEEVDKIITIASHIGELDKAEVLSRVLLNRHLRV